MRKFTKIPKSNLPLRGGRPLNVPPPEGLKDGSLKGGSLKGGSLKGGSLPTCRGGSDSAGILMASVGKFPTFVENKPYVRVRGRKNVHHEPVPTQYYFRLARQTTNTFSNLDKKSRCPSWLRRTVYCCFGLASNFVFHTK